MDRLCSTIFLLIIGALISNTFQVEELNVQLEPKNITVCEGDSVTLNCTFHPAGKNRVKLYYSQTNLDCNSATDEIREKWHISTGNKDNWSTFNIPSIKTSDSGWYFCKVTREIPILLRNCSDGIQVLVYSKSTLEYQNQTSNSTTEDLPTTCLIDNTFQVEEMNVQLEPKNITVCEGDSVTLNCTFQPAGKYKVKLYYSQTNLDCNSATDEIREKWHISTGNKDNWSTFNIPSIKTSDSGWYFCKVTRDIPILLRNCSDGIQVLVYAKSTLEYQNQTSNSTTEDLPTTCLIDTFQVEELNVQLEPKYIEVCEGDSVTLNCTFQPCGKHKVKWYYSQTNLDCNSATDTIREKWHIITGNNDNWSTFNITSIKTSDSGWYFCKVTRDIPILIENCSDGIQVLVTSTCRIMACL